MSYSAEISRRRKRFGVAVLAILLWIAAVVAITHLVPVPYFFSFFHPFAVIESFLLQWYDWAWIIPVLLVLLSLLGWLLLSRDIRAGRYVLIGSQCVILAADAVITPLHLINGMSLYTMFLGRIPSNLGTIALLGLTAAVYPIAVIVLTNKWKPVIKD